MFLKKIAFALMILSTSFCLTKRSLAQSKDVSAGSAQSPNAELPKEMKEPKSILATVGDYRVKQLVSPSFSNLSLQRKLYAYYWMQAMEAGHEIAWMQMSQGGLEIKHLLEKIFESKELLNKGELAALTDYYYEILLYDGLYDVTSNQKFFVKNMPQEKFKNLLDLLKISLDPTEKEELIRLMFDPDYRKYRKAVDGADKIAGSGTQFYGPGVTDVDIERLPESEAFHRLSFPVKDEVDGKIKLKLIKLDGHYGPHLQRMYEFINLAKNYAYPEELAMIEAYQKAMRTGDPQDLYNAEVEWVRYVPKDVGLNFYFVETYDDPRGRVATFQGGIYLIDNNPEAKVAAENLRNHAMDFEQAMPVNQIFKNTSHQKISETYVAELIYWVGGSRAGGPTGFNLPNDQKIRTEVGTQSIALLNKMKDLGEKSEFLEDQLNAFYHPDYREALKKKGRFSSLMTHVNFHEVLGHGSGRSLEGVQPEKVLGNLYESLEEGRAEVAAIYHMLDSARMTEYGIWNGMTQSEARDAAVLWAVQFFTDQIHSYTRLNGGTEIEQAHQLGRQIMLNWALKKGNEVIEIEYSPDGVPWVKIPDAGKLQKSMGDLWDLIQNIKSLGLYHFYQHMVKDNHRLTSLQQSWVEPVKEANKRLKRPLHTLYLNPSLDLVKDDKGQIKDVKLSYENPKESIDFIVPNEARRNSNRESSYRQLNACTGLF